MTTQCSACSVYPPIRREDTSAYLVAEIQITDDLWVPDYAANVHDLVEKYSGEYLTPSGNIKALEGQARRSTARPLGGMAHSSGSTPSRKRSQCAGSPCIRAPSRSRVM